MPKDKQFMLLTPKVVYRTNYGEPLHNRISIPVIDLDNPRRPIGARTGEVQVTVRQALELIETLTRAVHEFCQRGDINQVLLTTDPESVNRALRPA